MTNTNDQVTNNTNTGAGQDTKKAAYYDPESFGYKKIDATERQGMVNRVFTSVADNYDIMNDLMSGGMHRIWKTAFIDWMLPSRQETFSLLDVAGGTGDIASKFLDKAKTGSHAIVCDINGDMLRVGKQRAQDRAKDRHLTFVQGNAESLPFPDQHFDFYSIAFGIRNVTHIDTALEEAHRVLKTGGRFMCLEFSKVDVPVLDSFYDFFSFHAIPRIGQVVAGDKESYEYLVESIRKFPPQEQFAQMITEAGFEQVTWRNLSGGIAAIHSGWKL